METGRKLYDVSGYRLIRELYVAGDAVLWFLTGLEPSHADTMLYAAN